MARMKEGVTVWRCSCGAVIAMGRLCGCGKCYADILRERHRAQNAEQKQRQRRICEPTRRGKFFESFLVKKGEKK